MICTKLNTTHKEYQQKQNRTRHVMTNTNKKGNENTIEFR